MSFSLLEETGSVVKKFSEYFELNKSQPELDFVDITPGTDIPLFIDPYSASIRTDEWSIKCNLHIRSFFQTLINYIRSNHVNEAKNLLNYLHEPNETCLGLSSANPNGRRVGGKQASDLYQNLLKSQAAKTGLLSELAECDLFIEGIGRDKISDITTNIIRKLLIEYTQQQANLLGIELTEVASGFLWDSTQQRTKAGLDAARARGRSGGRKKIAPDNPKVLTAKRMHKNHGMSVDDICKTLKISRAIFYRYVSLG